MPTDNPLFEAELTYRQAINAALADAMADDHTICLLGEDVASDGGVFKTNTGLAEAFPTRVMNTPICENTFVGAALGMAITGMRPVVEIMFSDFLPTAADGLVEELPKFRFMSGGQCSVPVTIRSIGGGAGRFGTQHSATGESWFVALPGLKVATAGTPAGAYAVLRAAISDNNPVLFIEHKALYSRKGEVSRGSENIEVRRGVVVREGSDITVVATLLMLDRALEAARSLADQGVSLEVIDPQWLRPFDWELVLKSVSKTKRLMIVEEQVHTAGWGSTLISRIAQMGVELSVPPVAVSLADDMLVPYCPALEDAIIPSVATISAAATQLAASCVSALG